MLDFFFRHYAPWVDRFFLLDDGSTDGTLEYLQAREDVEVRSLEKVHPQSWVASAQHIYNSVWKQSRGQADWVVVTNIDEHLHHPDMTGYLKRMLSSGVTALPALGYQMVSEAMPDESCVLWRDHPMGAPWQNMSRLGIFRPDQISETHFAPGRHSARFEGNVVLPQTEEIINLHYKYFGVSQTHVRHQAQGERLGAVDHANNWGHKYAWSKAELEAEFASFQSRLIDTTQVDHQLSHTEPRWWCQAET